MKTFGLSRFLIQLLSQFKISNTKERTTYINFDNAKCIKLTTKRTKTIKIIQINLVVHNKMRTDLHKGLNEYTHACFRDVSADEYYVAAIKDLPCTITR